MNSIQPQPTGSFSHKRPPFLLLLESANGALHTSLGSSPDKTTEG
jgi:hypothetical protein